MAYHHVQVVVQSRPESHEGSQVICQEEGSHRYQFQACPDEMDHLHWEKHRFLQ